MPELQWSDSYAMDLPVMDDTHREFVDLLARVVRATDAQLMPLWDELVAHTDAHFTREDRWMTDTGFSPTNCHTAQHQVLLKVMREGSKRGGSGDLMVVRQMADELGVWFPQHANAMDAALAQHLRSVDYDDQTGQVNLPQALPTEEIEGCHGSSCTPHEESGAKLETT